MGKYAHPDVLVTTDWVADHINDSSVRLIEVDVDTEAYAEGHIQNAIGLSWESQLCDNVRRDILSKDQFETLCRENGITRDMTLVFYGDNNNWFACYALWQFRLYGHAEDKLKVMNGGRSKWISEGREFVTELPSLTASDYTASDPDLSVRAVRSNVFDTLEADEWNLVDVRSPAEFTGEVIAPPGMNETAQRGGHVPGACSIPWAMAVQDDGTFKSFDDLKTLYETRGVDLKKKTIAYCRIGERSSHSWFVLKYLLGVNEVSNYDGSWTEWGNLVGAPIEKG